MTPATGDRLVADLTTLDVESGATVLVHCSLSALGEVAGGEETVVLALCRALGPEGTMVVPSQSWQLCDPAYLEMAPEESWDETARHLAESRRGLPSTLPSPGCRPIDPISSGKWPGAEDGWLWS